MRRGGFKNPLTRSSSSSAGGAPSAESVPDSPPVLLLVPPLGSCSALGPGSHGCLSTWARGAAKCAEAVSCEPRRYTAEHKSTARTRISTAKHPCARRCAEVDCSPGWSVRSFLFLFSTSLGNEHISAVTSKWLETRQRPKRRLQTTVDVTPSSESHSQSPSQSPSQTCSRQRYGLSRHFPAFTSVSTSVRSHLLTRVAHAFNGFVRFVVIVLPSPPCTTRRWMFARPMVLWRYPWCFVVNTLWFSSRARSVQHSCSQRWRCSRVRCALSAIGPFST